MGRPVTVQPPFAGRWTPARAAPFTRRAGRELAFCLAGLPFAVVNPVVLFVLTVDLIWLAVDGARGNPSPAEIAVACACQGLLLVLLVSTPAARRLGSLQRRLATRLLGLRVAAPPPVRRGSGGRGWPGPRDGVGWRVMAYQLAKLPVGLIELYAVLLWIGGLVNLSYPLLWGAFRNHSAGVRLSPLPVFTPFGWFGDGTFRVATFPGTFAAAAAGAAMLLAAPWLTRAVTSVDARLICGLLGPGRLAQRVHDLELSRALAVDDSAALLRRLERDLHDGAQIRLATVAMNLGMAREKLGDGANDGDGAEVADAAAARELVDAALRGAKEALGELRSLVRGIHPPVLDGGLADALASLATDSAIPVELEVGIPVRPTPAIETIAYFCAAELLANAAKHSLATRITIRAAGHRDVLLLSVTDDGTGGANDGTGGAGTGAGGTGGAGTAAGGRGGAGTAAGGTGGAGTGTGGTGGAGIGAGGADPARGGSGLAGLRQRVAVVDGSLTIVSPPGGPTTITVELPLSA